MPPKKLDAKAYAEARLARNAKPTGQMRARMAHHLAYGWSSSTYTKVCEAMRSDGTTDPGSRERKVADALEAYMRHTAPRAPTIPRGHGHLDPRDLVLWRGVRGLLYVPPVGGTLLSNGGCYASFSQHRRVAEMFADVGDTDGSASTLFRLDVRNVARSTPWAWFGPTARGERNVVGTPYNEGEVLLPPGYFKVLGVTPGVGGEPRVVDVAFSPEPRYLLRAQIPPLNSTGMPLVTTIGGKAVRFPDARLRNKVRVRAAAVAAAAATRVVAGSAAPRRRQGLVSRVRAVASWPFRRGRRTTTG